MTLIPLDDFTRKPDRALVEDPTCGIYRCNREIFIDPGLFDLEIKYLFEGNWIYLAHEARAFA